MAGRDTRPKEEILETHAQTGEAQRQQQEAAQRQVGGIDLSRLVAAKQQVRGAVTEQSAHAYQVASTTRRVFMEEVERSRDITLRGNVRDSEMMRIAANPEAFENCKVQYGYNQRQRIYSVATEFDGRPRILTVRVGENFMEMSLADRQGTVLETMRQEDGRGITYSRAG
ncbi:MAG: hypothetical protein AB1529_02330 [Candidatus Micrarchaeota archaeon]